MSVTFPGGVRRRCGRKNADLKFLYAGVTDNFALRWKICFKLFAKLSVTYSDSGVNTGGDPVQGSSDAPVFLYSNLDKEPLNKVYFLVNKGVSTAL